MQLKKADKQRETRVYRAVKRGIKFELKLSVIENLKEIKYVKVQS